MLELRDRVVAVMRQAGTDPNGSRLRGLIIVLWRAGLRISEALALKSDLEVTRGSVLVRRGKGGRWMTLSGTPSLAISTRRSAHAALR